jgi:hypothetical protein
MSRWIIAQDVEHVLDVEHVVAGEDILERAAAHQSHGVERDGVPLADREDRHDMRVVESGRELGLALESAVGLG